MSYIPPYQRGQGDVVGAIHELPLHLATEGFSPLQSIYIPPIKEFRGMSYIPP